MCKLIDAWAMAAYDKVLDAVWDSMNDEQWRIYVTDYEPIRL